MKSKLNLVKGNRIGSWEGTDVIFTTQKDYENLSDKEIKNKIYAFSVHNYFDDITNIYMVKNDTVFAYLLNEFGDIKLLKDDRFTYLGRINKMQQKYKQKQKKEIPKVNEVETVASSVREVINKTKEEKENVNKIKRGKRAGITIQEEKVLGKSVDEWLAFAVSSSVTDYTQELSKNVDEIIREVEN